MRKSLERVKKKKAGETRRKRERERARPLLVERWRRERAASAVVASPHTRRLFMDDTDSPPLDLDNAAMIAP